MKLRNILDKYPKAHHVAYVDEEGRSRIYIRGLSINENFEIPKNTHKNAIIYVDDKEIDIERKEKTTEKDKKETKTKKRRSK